MTILLGELAALAGGRLIGDPSRECRGAGPPGEAKADQVTMVEDPRRGKLVADGPAVAVVTPAEGEFGETAQIIVDDPHASFARVVAHFRPPLRDVSPEVGIDPTATVAASARVDPSATIGAGTTIGERVRILPGVVVMPRCEIGDDCVIHANVTLYEYTRLGSRVVIHAGSVIGAHGFGYRQHEGRHVPTSQLGYVDIEADVELGACVTIDRGTYAATRIGEGTKIDNQVMIGHNCQIGRHNLFCSQVGIAGSCRTGDYVVLAGQVGLKDHITLGDRTVVGAQAGVIEDCAGDQVYLGSPATTQREQMQIVAVERRLPEMRRSIKELRRDLERLERQLRDGEDGHRDQGGAGDDRDVAPEPRRVA